MNKGRTRHPWLHRDHYADAADADAAACQLRQGVAARCSVPCISLQRAMVHRRAAGSPAPRPVANENNLIMCTLVCATPTERHRIALVERETNHS